MTTYYEHNSSFLVSVKISLRFGGFGNCAEPRDKPYLVSVAIFDGTEWQTGCSHGSSLPDAKNLGLNILHYTIDHTAEVAGVQSETENSVRAEAKVILAELEAEEVTSWN